MNVAEEIKNYLMENESNVVCVYNTYHIWYYRQKHASWFKVDSRGSLFVKRGKKSVCLSGCGIKFGKVVTN